MIVPGNPDKSRVFTLTAHKEEPKMPPKGDRIPDAQLNTLRLWVEQGGRENAPAGRRRSHHSAWRSRRLTPEHIMDTLYP